MNAETARKIYTESVDKKLKCIFDLIEAASKDGRNEIIINKDELPPGGWLRLTALGFDIINLNDRQNHNISW